MLGKRKKANRLRPEKKERRKPQISQMQQWKLTQVRLPMRSMAVAALVGLVCVIAWRLADRPVSAILVNAPFQRVTAMQIEEVVRAELGRGNVLADV